MKTYPVLRAGYDFPFAFEIENAYIAPSAAANVLAGVRGVTDIKQRAALSSSSDVHLEFKYGGHPYMVWEPYGDNSRYWVGPSDANDAVDDISELEAAFKAYRPPLHRELLGDLVSLRLIGHLINRR